MHLPRWVIIDEALDLTAEQLEDADLHRLHFVVPYALLVQALAKAGLRDYLVAQELLDEAEQRALKAGDQNGVPHRLGDPSPNLRSPRRV